MGTRVIRQGGTVSQSFRWKDWRGVPWQRASMQARWSGEGSMQPSNPCRHVAVWGVEHAASQADAWRSPAPALQHVWGDSLVSGWGLFEFIDMANALDITPVGGLGIGGEG